MNEAAQKKKRRDSNWNIAATPNPFQTKSLKSKVEFSSLLVIVKSFLSTFFEQIGEFLSLIFFGASTRMPGPIVDLAIPPGGSYKSVKLWYVV